MEDLECMVAIYTRARAFMKEHGNERQWGPTKWPPTNLLISDIEQNKSYVLEHEGKIIGTFYFDEGIDFDKTYLHIEEGNWRKDGHYGVVHRIASDGSKGVGTFCINWALQKAGYLRIDTHPDNTVMRSLLQKLGFHQCGVIYVEEDNDPRYAFDKFIESN